MIAIAIAYQPHFVRLTRASVIAERGRDYVTATRHDRRQSAAPDGS